MRTLLLVLALLAAGCLGEEAPAAEVTPAGEETVGETATSIETGASGTGLGSAADANETQPTRVPLAFEGSFPAFVEACAWVTITWECALAPPGATFENRYVFPASGNATRLEITLTWTPTSSLAERLSVNVHSFSESDFVVHGEIAGPSPLTLVIDAPFPLPADWTNRIGIGVEDHSTDIGPAAGRVWALPAEQTFSLVGTLVLSPPPNP